MRIPATRVPVCTLVLAAVAAAQGPCYEHQLGTAMAMLDDSVVVQPLGFTFPFNGQSVTSIGICSNGYIWLDNGVSTVADFTPSEAEFLSGPPRVAPRWVDLYPPTTQPGGGVFFNALPGRAVITWDRVAFYGDRAQFASMQVQLDVNGAITFYWHPTSGNYAGASVAGTTAGNNTAANLVDLSTAPLNFGTTVTGYELFNTGTAGTFDLYSTTGQFWISNGTNGLLTIPTLCQPATSVPYGSGCPKNGTVYETFPSNGIDLANTSIRFVFNGSGYTAVAGPGLDTSYAAPVAGAGDDTVHQGLALGFPFPFQGGVHTTIDVCSNGFVWAASSTVFDYSPTVPEFLSELPRIAPMWRDFNFVSGGTLYFDTTPTTAMVSWVNVPNYGQTGTSSTVQLKLHAGGDIEFNYGSLSVQNPALSPVTLVGFTEGNNAADPGPVDYTTAVPGLTVGSAGNTPLSLVSIIPPVLGGNFVTEIRNIPAGTSVAALILGFNRVAIDASIYGMAGCTQHVSLDSTTLGFVSGSTHQFSLALPSNPAFLGFLLYGQGLSFSAGFNALGLIATNGIQTTAGM